MAVKAKGREDAAAVEAVLCKDLTLPSVGVQSMRQALRSRGGGMCVQIGEQSVRDPTLYNYNYLSRPTLLSATRCSQAYL